MPVRTTVTVPEPSASRAALTCAAEASQSSGALTSVALSLPSPFLSQPSVKVPALRATAIRCTSATLAVPSVVVVTATPSKAKTSLTGALVLLIESFSDVEKVPLIRACSAVVRPMSPEISPARPDAVSTIAPLPLASVTPRSSVVGHGAAVVTEEQADVAERDPDDLGAALRW